MGRNPEDRPGRGSGMNGSEIPKADLLGLTENRVLMEVARRAVEDALVEWRDSSMFVLRNNGFTIRGKDGSASSIVRFGTEDGLRIALRAIANISDEELAALRAVFDADGGITPELVEAYEKIHAAKTAQS